MSARVANTRVDVVVVAVVVVLVGGGGDEFFSRARAPLEIPTRAPIIKESAREKESREIGTAE